LRKSHFYVRILATDGLTDKQMDSINGIRRVYSLLAVASVALMSRSSWIAAVEDSVRSGERWSQSP